MSNCSYITGCSWLKYITINPLSLNSNWLHFQFMKVHIRISSPCYQDTFLHSSHKKKKWPETGKIATKCCSFCTSKRIFSLFLCSALSSNLLQHLHTYKLSFRLIAWMLKLFIPILMYSVLFCMKINYSIFVLLFLL